MIKDLDEIGVHWLSAALSLPSSSHLPSWVSCSLSTLDHPKKWISNSNSHPDIEYSKFYSRFFFKKVKNVKLAPNERIIGWLCNKEGKGERWKWGIGEIRPESRYIYITRGIDSGRVNFLVAFCQPPRVLPIQRNLTGVGCDRGVAPLSSFYLLSPLGKSFLIRKIWRGTFRKNVRMVLCKHYYLSSLLYVKDPYIYAVNRIIRRDFFFKLRL